jgi:hypothetical protein
MIGLRPVLAVGADQLVEPDLAPLIPRHVLEYKRYAAPPEEDHHDRSQQKNYVDEQPHLGP